MTEDAGGYIDVSKLCVLDPLITFSEASITQVQYLEIVTTNVDAVCATLVRRVNRWAYLVGSC